MHCHEKDCSPRNGLFWCISLRYQSNSAGAPSAVSNLTSIFLILEQVICLTWNVPFTLDITGVDPDISYCVEIRAVTVTDNIDSTPLTTNCSVYMPKFNFTMDYPNTSTSMIYEFQVTPRNDAGYGPTSAPVSGFFSGRELFHHNLNTEHYW